jgi:4-azaleucine resistance transporter AzlC
MYSPSPHDAATPAPPLPPSLVRSPWLLSVPVAMGYIPLGMVFGFLFVQAGGAWWMAMLASVVIYAGAAQFMMVPMVAAGLPIATIALATAVVNLRHVFYGLSLLHTLPKRWSAKAYLVFGLTDETYSVLTTLPPGATTKDMVVVTVLNQAWWITGTTVGAIIGAQAQVQLVGLDFALAALFAVLAVEQWRSSSSAQALWVALVAYVLALWVWPQQALLVAIALSVVAGLWLQGRARKAEQSAASV